MKKPNLIFIYLLAFLICMSSFTETQKDEDNCLKKIKGEWGKGQGCTNRSKSYKVSFVNNCTDTLDIKMAVQERSLRWKTFKYFKVPPGDTISGYSCDATGKYITWKKPTDDASIIFPSDEEINRDNR